MTKDTQLKSFFNDILSESGIQFDGPNKWDPQVKNPAVYSRVIAFGSLGLGESYMEGWWECEDLDGFFYRLLKSKIHEKHARAINPSNIWFVLKAKLFNQQSKTKSFQVGEEHYDAGNDLYELMLDPTLGYTCGYFKNTEDLEQAQINKYDLICKKMSLQKGMKILDIGCGWGGFLKYASENYGVTGYGVTVSKEQAKLGNQRLKDLPVEIRLIDYRDIENDTFDRIVSIGMFEHVGPKNYKTFMEKAYTLLKDNGYFLLHTIGNNSSTLIGDAWYDKYIFPNGVLPSVKQIAQATEGNLIIEDLQNIGPDYVKTLLAWHKNFTANWGKIQDKYSTKFYRMWVYYLLSSAGSFRARNIQLWQIVLSKNVDEIYISPR